MNNVHIKSGDKVRTSTDEVFVVRRVMECRDWAELVPAGDNISKRRRNRFARISELEYLGSAR
jgi:hypothetical protein